MTHEFTIVASGPDPRADDFESRFYDAGCDDATVSFQKGHVLIDFAREADTFAEALASAIEAVRAAGAVVVRVEPDPLVSLSDIAARADMTRAAISLYAKGARGDGDFPAPVARVTTESPLWEWAAVSKWLYRRRKLARPEVVAALAVAEANALVASGVGDFAARLSRRVQDVEKSI